MPEIKLIIYTYNVLNNYNISLIAIEFQIKLLIRIMYMTNNFVLFLIYA